MNDSVRIAWVSNDQQVRIIAYSRASPTIEVRDGCDAIGVPRWRTVNPKAYADPFPAVLMAMRDALVAASEAHTEPVAEEGACLDAQVGRAPHGSTQDA